MQNANYSVRHSIGSEAAIALAETGWWKNKSAREICDVQLFTEELCMNFPDFQRAMAEALGRPVYTHEFAMDYGGLVAEYLGQREAPSLESIASLIPAEKRVVIRV